MRRKVLTLSPLKKKIWHIWRQYDRSEEKRKEKEKSRKYNPLKTFDVNPVGETIRKEKGIDTIHKHKIYYQRYAIARTKEVGANNTHRDWQRACGTYSIREIKNQWCTRGLTEGLDTYGRLPMVLAGIDRGPAALTALEKSRTNGAHGDWQRAQTLIGGYQWCSQGLTEGLRHLWQCNAAEPFEGIICEPIGIL
jgi:hypothetical protein